MVSTMAGRTSQSMGKGSMKRVSKQPVKELDRHPGCVELSAAWLLTACTEGSPGWWPSSSGSACSNFGQSQSAAIDS